MKNVKWSDLTGHFSSLGLDSHELSWASWRECHARLTSYARPTSLVDVINPRMCRRKTTKSTGVVFPKKLVGWGQCNFRGLERLPNFRNHSREVVLKKYCAAGENFFDDSPELCEMAVEVQCIAAYLAERYTQEVLAKLGRGHEIKFTESQVLALYKHYGGPGEKPVGHMVCEKSYPAGYKTLRFSTGSNSSKASSALVALEDAVEKKGVKLTYLRQVMAFSHWSYQISHGYLMVVEPVGIIGRRHCCCETSGMWQLRRGVELTDPTIHCIDSTRFGDANRGVEGMKQFFSSHVCSEFCEKLGLRPRPKLPEEEDD